MNTRKGTIVPGQWYHLAFVVREDSLTVYVNGKPEGGMRARGRKGIGGFGDFPLNGSGDGAWDAELAELRFWKTARSEEVIREMMHDTFAEMGRPEDLLACYNGSVYQEGKKSFWNDRTGRFAAELVHAEGVKEMALPVLAHRVLLRSGGLDRSITAQKVIQELLNQTPVPTEE